MAGRLGNCCRVADRSYSETSIKGDSALDAARLSDREIIAAFDKRDEIKETEKGRSSSWSPSLEAAAKRV